MLHYGASNFQTLDKIINMSKAAECGLSFVQTQYLLIQQTAHITMVTVKAFHNDVVLIKAVPNKYGSSKVRVDLYVIIKAIPNMCGCG